MNSIELFDRYAMTVQTVPEDLGGGFEALFPQLARGVVGYGATRLEAIGDLVEAVPGFLEAVVELGTSLPEPALSAEWDEFSGKFNVRVPRALHAKLVRLAEQQGVSLNSLVQCLLSSGTTALESGREFGSADHTSGQHSRVVRDSSDRTGRGRRASVVSTHT